MKIHLLSLLAGFLVSATFAADQKPFTAPPHGGTPVVVGSHGYHLELVRDAEKGKLQAYVIDAHFERFVDVPEKTFDMVAGINGTEQKITFNRVAAAGKTAEADSNVFEGTADWVKTATNFNAIIPTITLKGRTFRNVRVSFPKGAIHRAH